MSSLDLLRENPRNFLSSGKSTECLPSQHVAKAGGGLPWMQVGTDARPSHAVWEDAGGAEASCQCRSQGSTQEKRGRVG